MWMKQNESRDIRIGTYNPRVGTPIYGLFGYVRTQIVWFLATAPKQSIESFF